LKGKKNGARGKSLSSLAAGLSTGGRPAPVNPLVAALARKSEPAKKRITAGLMTPQRQASAPFVAVVRSPPPRSSREQSRAESPQSSTPAKFIAAKPQTPGARPESRPGPTSGIVAGLAGTSRTAASVAPLVKTAEASRAAPKGLGPEHRRQYPRADLQVKAKLSLADDPSHNFEAALPTANLSVGGLFLASTFFLKMGTKLEVRLSLPPHGREVHVKAQVVRVDANDEQSSGFALRFTDYLDGSEVVLATHFLSPVLREFISGYAKGNGFKPTAEYLSHTADVLAAWELRRAALGGDVWVVPGEQR